MPQAVDAALESQSALDDAAKQREFSDATSASYQRVVAEYEQRLAEAIDDRVRCREEMRAFGAYLRMRGVAPEHIVPCVHLALRRDPATGESSEKRAIDREIVGWAIEGYYGTHE